jgi:hypothetical protein
MMGDDKNKEAEPFHKEAGRAYRSIKGWFNGSSEPRPPLSKEVVDKVNSDLDRTVQEYEKAGREAGCRACSATWIGHDASRRAMDHQVVHQHSVWIR